jgi:hypothetical protein
MNFCAKCGRERSGDARYCGGCGTEFAAASAAAGTPPTDDPGGGDPQPSPTVEAQAVTPAAAEPPPADATRVERRPDVTMIDRPRAAEPAPAATPAAAEPDPFAAWFAPDAQAAPRTEPAGQWQAAQPWQSADTVYAGSGQRPAAYPPPSPSPSPSGPGYPPPYGAKPGPPPGRRGSSGGRKAAFIVVVALIMLAAGGGAYALVSRSSKLTTQPPASPTAVSSATPTAPSSASASSSPGTASPSASASASSVPSLVSLGPGVASTGAEPAVETTLSRYFQGINTHNYTEYQSAHNAHEQAIESESAFDSGYGSTQDSGMTLTSLASTASGESATVTFTSHQDKGTGIDGSACNNWQLTYFLVPHGTGYLIGAAPAGYKPIYSDC